MCEMASVNGEVRVADGGNVNLRCPRCSRTGVFYQPAKDAHWPEPVGPQRFVPAFAGVRICPNSECKAFVFVAIKGGVVDQTYPPQVIDFDATNLPDSIKSSMAEAIQCHAAGCFRAAALMVRRVLEELCEDKQAQGGNLMQRLQALRSTIVVPQELMDAANELRLLGNDAAHIEAKTYDAIEAEEIEVALDLTKELLKAVYQLGSLVDRMRALKKP